ncbi:hypothetical protein ACFVTC_30355 [Streptomyces sp. NPDC057950]|uniref:hypothetical protein n=1 Tax=Streptomyces sp. NPDC057950 TaxID=3346288 RepID=UPI0036E8C57B
MAYVVDVLDEPDIAVGHEERERRATGAGRFAPAGLLKRRRPGPETYGDFSRPAPPRPLGGVVGQPPQSALPTGLLPLPTGFELSVMAAVG